MPKCGGISFRELLESHYGSGLLLDYKDLPLHKSDVIRRRAAKRAYLNNVLWGRIRLKGVECIHGHFLPYKYLPLARTRNVRFVVWLRDPLERLASHYNFWLRVYDAKKSAPLHRKVLEEGWSLEQFCFAPELRNVYSKFLWGFDLHMFDFVGITEFFQEDISEFAQLYFEQEIKIAPKKNTNPTGNVSYFEGKEELKLKLEKWHSEDYRIYNCGLELRKQRMNSSKL